MLFTQVVGKKRIYLIHPNFSARFFPFLNNSGIAVHKFEEEERQQFFKFNQAFECILEPGETLYIAKLWWHYLENIGTTVAFNVRFGLTPFNRRLRAFPATYLLQNLSRVLVDPVKMRVNFEMIYQNLIETYFKKYSSSEKRYKAHNNVMQEAFQTLCKGAIKVVYGQPKLNDENRYDVLSQFIPCRTWEPCYIKRGKPYVNLFNNIGPFPGSKLPKSLAHSHLLCVFSVVPEKVFFIHSFDLSVRS